MADKAKDIHEGTLLYALFVPLLEKETAKPNSVQSLFAMESQKNNEG